MAFFLPFALSFLPFHDSALSLQVRTVRAVQRPVTRLGALWPPPDGEHIRRLIPTRALPRTRTAVAARGFFAAMLPSSASEKKRPESCGCGGGAGRAAAKRTRYGERGRDVRTARVQRGRLRLARLDFAISGWGE